MNVFIRGAFLNLDVISVAEEREAWWAENLFCLMLLPISWFGNVLVVGIVCRLLSIMFCKYIMYIAYLIVLLEQNCAYTRILT